MANHLPVHDIDTRIALLEARVRLLILALEGLIATIAAALLAYFFKG